MLSFSIRRIHSHRLNVLFLYTSVVILILNLCIEKPKVITLSINPSELHVQGKEKKTEVNIAKFW